jgi:hypothetical protein
MVVNGSARQRLQAAFRRLRREGYAARMNFSCCGTCGSYELSQEVTKRRLAGYVFWHRQANDAFSLSGDLETSLWL